MTANVASVIIKSALNVLFVDILLRRLDITVTPLPALKIRQGLLKFFLVKIRPKGVSKIKFGIRQLPEKEIADAFLA